MQPLSLDEDGSPQTNQNQPDSGSVKPGHTRVATFHPNCRIYTIEHFEGRLSGAASPPFGFDLQNPWRGQAGSTETTPAVFYPSSNDVVPFQASPWLFEGENTGFPASVTPGSTTDLFLPRAYIDALDAQAGLKSSDQDFGLEIPFSNNDGNSPGNLGSQSWAVSIPTRVPSHAIARPVTFTNNFMDIGFVPNNYAQGTDHSALDSDFNLQASNVPAIGPHSLDFFSMDVGQPFFTMLMPASDNSQEFVFESSQTFSNPKIYQDLLSNNNVSSLPNGNTFDPIGSQHVQVPQGQARDSQDDAYTLPGPTTIPNQPNPVQHLTNSSTFACAHDNCNQVFRRKSDLARHRQTVHGVNHIKFFCHIPGCPKGRGHGEGYSRDDKLTEHLWKKHGNLGYTKSR